MEATDSGIHHFSALAKFFQGSLTEHSTAIGLIVFTQRFQGERFVRMQRNATRILCGPHPAPSPQLRSQVGENVPNVTSSKEQKQMLLYLFIFVLGSTLI